MARYAASYSSSSPRRLFRPEAQQWQRERERERPVKKEREPRLSGRESLLPARRSRLCSSIPSPFTPLASVKGSGSRRCHESAACALVESAPAQVEWSPRIVSIRDRRYLAVYSVCRTVHDLVIHEPRKTNRVIGFFTYIRFFHPRTLYISISRSFDVTGGLLRDIFGTRVQNC